MERELWCVYHRFAILTTQGYRDISIRQMRQRRKLQTKTIIDEWQRTNIYSEMIVTLHLIRIS